jgi:hypothetical protein
MVQFITLREFWVKKYIRKELGRQEGLDFHSFPESKLMKHAWMTIVHVISSSLHFRFNVLSNALKNCKIRVTMQSYTCLKFVHLQPLEHRA